MFRYSRGIATAHIQSNSAVHTKNLNGELSTWSYHLQYSACVVEMAYASTLKSNVDKMHQDEHICTSCIQSAIHVFPPGNSQAKHGSNKQWFLLRS